MKLSYEVEKLEERLRRAEEVAYTFAYAIANSLDGKPSSGMRRKAEEWLEARNR